MGEVYVVTSDQEEAIRGGLNTSVLRDVSFQIMCGLHAKWNVSAHKYVNVSTYHVCITITSYFEVAL